MVDRYLNLARRGKNNWWRYLLSIILILFSWLAIGSLPTVILILLVDDDNNPKTQFNWATSQFVGVSPLISYLAINLSFVIFMLSLYVAVRFIHQRRFVTLVTPKKRIRWQRVIRGLSIYLLFNIASSVVESIIFPGTYKLNANLKDFLIFLPIALIFTPIQTSVEELFFRGYLMQAIGLRTRIAGIPVLTTSVIFMLLHLGNPEVLANLSILAIYYLGLALFLAIITVKDNTLELAIGIHAANNLFIALFVNYPDSALPSPAIFMSQLHPVFSLFSFMVMTLIFYAIFFRNKKLVSTNSNSTYLGYRGGNKRRR